MTAAAAALTTAFSSSNKPMAGRWSMPIAVAIAVAAHALLLLGLEIKAPEASARPTHRLELMVVTEPGVESATDVPARVSAQTDRAGETQALLPELEAAAIGSTDSSALDGALAPNSSEQPLAPSEPTADSPRSEPPPASAESEQAAPPQPEQALPAEERAEPTNPDATRHEPPSLPAERAQPAAPALEALPAPGAVGASSAAEAGIQAESLDRIATPESEAGLIPDPLPAAPEQLEQAAQPELTEQAEQAALLEQTEQPEQAVQPEQTEQTEQTEQAAQLEQPARVELDRPALPISAADIFASRNAEMASLAARIEERSQAYASRTRRKAISTATREYIYANYMEAWRRKVERIGNLNYPREARELGLFGSLILHVAVRADGSLEGIRVVRSSGHEVLDQAAVRIVELAAPFAAFPPDIKRETDVLDITRTWQFQRNHELSWGN